MPAPTPLHVKQIPLERLHAAPWNANVVPARTLAKIRRSITDFGIVENLVGRTLPTPCPVCGDKSGDCREVVSGNHRLELYAELELRRAPVHTVELDDAHARLLAQTLNRTRGEDDPERYAQLLRDTLERLTIPEVLAYLPETEHSIEKLLGEQIKPEANFGTMPRPGRAKSKLGEIYELGPHRLMCGSALDLKSVNKLLAGEEPILLLTDPPYGVKLDMSWRRGEKRRKGGVVKTKTPAQYADSIKGDDRVDWSEAFALVPSLTAAYVWHASSFGHIVANGLESIGFQIVQMIVWDKGRFVLGRGQYQFQHEAAWYAARNGREVPFYAPRSVPAWYARKKGSGTPWLGGHDQTTIWEAPSPKLMRAKDGNLEDSGYDHPTQKPVEIYTRPIKNHLELGGAFYDPFGGSGTGIISAEITGRRCYSMEIDPRFCDLIRRRYAEFTGRDELAP